VNGLKEKAVLIDLSICCWEARGEDKKITRETTERYNASADAGKWNKRKLAKADLDRIQKAASRARTFHKENTFPWIPRGPSLLPVDHYFDYMKGIAKIQDEFFDAVGEFLPKYPELVEASRQRLGDTWKAEDYPPTSAIRRKFSFSTDVYPIPDSEDFRVSLSEEEMEAIKEELTALTENRLSSAMEELWKRLHQKVARMAERLSDPENKFHDTLISNLKEMTKRIPHLNLTDDVELDKLTTEIAYKLCAVSPKELRKEEDTRKAVSGEAEKILRRMEEYAGYLKADTK